MALTKKDSPLVSLDDDEGGIGSWYNEHASAINWVLGIVLIAVLGWRAYDYVHQSRIEKANAAYSDAQQAYGNALTESDAEKRKKDLQSAAPKLEEVAGANSAQPVGREAQLQAGNALFYLAESQTGAEATENFKKAQAAYQKYISMAESDRERAVGQLALGNTLENLLFLTKEAPNGVEAINAYKEVERLAPGTYLAAESGLAQARVLQAQQGRQDEARKLYETVASERKLAPPSWKSEDTTLTTQQGRDLSPEEIADIRSMKKFSYENVAEKSIERLKGLPTGK